MTEKENFTFFHDLLRISKCDTGGNFSPDVYAENLHKANLLSMDTTLDVFSRVYIYFEIPR